MCACVCGAGVCGVGVCVHVCGVGACGVGAGVCGVGVCVVSVQVCVWCRCVHSAYPRELACLTTLFQALLALHPLLLL